MIFSKNNFFFNKKLFKNKTEGVYIVLKILAIAPYENLKKKFDQVSQKFDGIELTSYEGDLDNGVRLVKEEEDKFDIIISRGGTAKEIKSASKLPVIEVDISILDILRIIKMIENYTQYFVFVGYANITKQVEILSEVLDKQIDVMTITKQSEVPEIIAKVKENNYTLVIGDKITTRIAQEHELNAILIDSGEESITNAIEEAITMGTIFINQSNKQRYEEMILQNLNLTVFLFDPDENLIYANPSDETVKQLPLLKKIILKLKEQKKDKISSYEEYNHHLFYIEAILLKNGFLIYSKKEKLTFNKDQLFIKEAASSIENTKRNSSIFIGDDMKTLKKLLDKKVNLVFYGEKGTGKKSIKKIIMNREESKNYWTLNLNNHFTKNEWNSLFNSPNSIFYDENTTFFVEGICDTNITYLKDLISFIQQAPNRSNRWFFSLTINKNTKIALRTLLDASNILSFKIKPLRQRTEELGSIVSLYTYEFKTRHNKNIIGFEPSALDEMKNYSWPGNMEQLKKAVEKMVILTSNAFISKSTVQHYIKQSEAMYDEEKVLQSFDIHELRNKSLEEIKQLIIKRLLDDNNGNKTKTADELEISRSTLWRYLK